MRSLIMQTGASDDAETKATPLSVYKFVTHFGIGGTEMQVLGLAEQFDPRHFLLSFGCMRRQGASEREYEDRGWSISEYPVKRFASIGAARQVVRLSRELRARRPLVMHSYNFYANVFSIPAARLAGVPCVVASIRDMGVYLTPMQLRVQRWVCGLADRIVVNADAVRDWLVEDGYAPRKIHVIRNGVRTNLLDTVSTRRCVRAELGIPAAAQVVMMVSRLNPQKGIEHLLECAPAILGRFPDAWFVIVGDVVMGSRAEEEAYARFLASRARELGVAKRVVFTGLRRDIPNLLAAADISVLPSLSEGLPNSVIEAMAAALPVVATKVGGVPELIQHGRHGLLVSPGNREALVESITALLANPFLSRRLGEAARTRIETGFSFEKMFQETVSLYRTVLAEKQQARTCLAREDEA